MSSVLKLTGLLFWRVVARMPEYLNNVLRLETLERQIMASPRRSALVHASFCLYCCLVTESCSHWTPRFCPKDALTSPLEPTDQFLWRRICRKLRSLCVNAQEAPPFLRSASCGRACDWQMGDDGLCEFVKKAVWVIYWEHLAFTSEFSSALIVKLKAEVHKYCSICFIEVSSSLALRSLVIWSRLWKVFVFSVQG